MNGYDVHKVPYQNVEIVKFMALGQGFKLYSGANCNNIAPSLLFFWSGGRTLAAL